MGKNTVRCKTCHKRFSLHQWQSQQICEHVGCNCPNVQRSMQMANEVIEKMLNTKETNIINVQSFAVPDGIDEIEKGKDKYYYDCPKVMRTVITPPGARGSFLNRKQRGGK